MAVIRPYSPPVITPPQGASSPVRVRGAAEAKAAQRAFFQQALGDSTPVRAASVATAATASGPAQPSRDIRRPIPDEPPTRLMRPGSFVDVKV